MVRRCVTYVVLLGACGRFGFREAAHDSSRDAAAPDAAHDAMNDASACIEGDSTCLVSCVGMDSDCVTTCGDGRCVGNAGELCPTCGADCDTATAVCGNGACDPGELPDCYADCGPSPWQWTAEEQALVDEVNKYRMQGVQCPGEPMTRTAPPYTVDPSFQLYVREAAWEIAHHDYFMNNGAGCNGRTFGDRLTAGNYDAQTTQRLQTTAPGAVTAWLSDSVLCPIVMSTTYTVVAPAYATDVRHAWVAGYR